MLYIYLTIVILSLAGFLVARYIWKHKRAPKGTPFVCPLGLQCDEVVNSKYSNTFGVHNELGGMAYYGGLFLFYGLALVYPSIIPEVLFDLATLATLGAFLFSIYLVFIMWKVLKAWCSWCITSAILSTIIFALTAYVYFI